MTEGQPQGRRERATMRDVAALAGVALKTVSRVVNGVSTVDPVLAERVRQASVKLGYRPNLAASSLRRGRTNTVGLVLEDISNPFSASLCRSIENAAREHGVLLIVVSVDEDPNREREAVSTLIDRRVDGLVVMPAGRDHRYLVSEQQTGVPFVFVDRPPIPLLADTVVTDNRAASAAGVRHMLRGGHQHVAYVGDDPSIETAQDRFAGFADALTEAGLPLRDNHVRHNLRTARDAREVVLEMISGPQRPDAIFSSQNLVTIGCVEALHERGLQHEISLLGFDDLPLAEAVQPAVSVLAQDIAGIGRLAVRRLFDRMAGDEAPPQILVVPSRLIARGSAELVRS